jgi:hypothetical protein
MFVLIVSKFSSFFVYTQTKLTKDTFLSSTTANQKAMIEFLLTQKVFLTGSMVYAPLLAATQDSKHCGDIDVLLNGISTSFLVAKLEDRFKAPAEIVSTSSAVCKVCCCCCWLARSLVSSLFFFQL